jgi:hypothetical protein
MLQVEAEGDEQYWANGTDWANSKDSLDAGTLPKPDPVSSAFATLNRAQSAIISSGAFWVSYAMPLHWQGAMTTRR